MPAARLGRGTFRSFHPLTTQLGSLIISPRVPARRLWRGAFRSYHPLRRQVPTISPLRPGAKEDQQAAERDAGVRRALQPGGAAQAGTCSTHYLLLK